MIFQLSDWFPKPMISAIIVKFDQIRKNWWRISCAEILEVRKFFFSASSVKKMSWFEVSPEEIKRIAWKFTKIRPRWLYISSYPASPRRITVKYYCTITRILFTSWTEPTFKDLVDNHSRQMDECSDRRRLVSQPVFKEFLESHAPKLYKIILDSILSEHHGEKRANLQEKRETALIWQLLYYRYV